MKHDDKCSNETIQQFCEEYLVISFFSQSGTDEAGSMHDEINTAEHAIIVLYSALFAIGLVCNILVIVGMIANYNTMVTGSHIYALHMAFADLLLIIMLPFHIIELRDGEIWRFGLGFCKIYRLIKVMNFLVSITFLTLMAIDRYSALSRNYRPIRQRKRPPKIAHAIACVVWLSSFALALPVYLRAQLTNDDPKSGHCYELWNDYTYTKKYDTTYFSNHSAQMNICYLNVGTEPNSTTKLTENLRFEELGFLEKLPNDILLEDHTIQTSVDVHIDAIFAPTLKHRRSADIFFTDDKDNTLYKELLKDPKLAHFCEFELHDCGKDPNSQCPQDNINPCLCPLAESHRKYQIVTFVLAFIIPVNIIIYCYTRFLVRICTISKSINTYGKMSMSSNHQAEIRRLAVLVMSLIIAFLICWTPVELRALVSFSGMGQSICSHKCLMLEKVSRALVWLSATINSLLYICMGGFRKRIKESVNKYLSDATKTNTTQRETLLDNTVTREVSRNDSTVILTSVSSPKYLSSPLE